MNARQIVELSAGFEMGGHTLRHVRLTTLDAESSWREILGSRTWLSDVLGALPGRSVTREGSGSPAIRGEVAEAGFQLARTTELLGQRR